jgi:ubiquitin-conjugating enzyme E2 D
MIFGPDNSPYAGGLFMFDIKIPPDYPFKCPEVILKTKIYHPSFVGSSVCRDCGYWKTYWSPERNIFWVLNVYKNIIRNIGGGCPIN